MLGAGILVAQLVNIGAFNIRPWGWRLSLGLAAVPGTILLLGGLFLPESPNSLIERGQFEAGRRVLQRIRGTKQVEEEYQTIVAAQQVCNLFMCIQTQCCVMLLMCLMSSWARFKILSSDSCSDIGCACC